ncbi:MAG: hypothetical protein ACOYMW_08495 [Candidatus Competibacteraceae bacterium]
MSNPFRGIDRHQPVTLPGDMVELVEAPDIRAIEAAYREGSSAPYLPKMIAGVDDRA